MNHKQRVLSALERKGYDRIPVKHYAIPETNEKLTDYLGIKDCTLPSTGACEIDVAEELFTTIGEDFRYIIPSYCGPEPRVFPDGSRTLVWPERGWPIPIRHVEKAFSTGGGFYLEPVVATYQEVTDPRSVAWPRPTCRCRSRRYLKTSIDPTLRKSPPPHAR